MKKRLRIEVYKKMVVVLRHNYYIGFCGAIDQVLYFDRMANPELSNKIQDYPELMKYKPKRFWTFIMRKRANTFFWWPNNPDGARLRIKILKEIIQKYEQKHPKS